ncbi:MAG: hypothetical protein KDB80_12440 [Planctomycetes bacterium]|nr:hypothetical protein [Planctomycetota bacterium]
MRSLPTSFSKFLGVVAVTAMLGPFASAQDAGTRDDSKSWWLDPHTGVELFSPQDRDYSVSTLFSQNHGELLQRAKGYRQDVRFSFLRDINAEVKGEPGSFDITEFELDAQYDFPIDPDSWMRVGGHIDRRDFSFSSAVVGPDDDETLWETGLIIGGGTFIDPGLFIEAQLEPGVYSDFEGGLNSKDWQFYGHVRATLQHDEFLFWRFGLRTDKLFEDVDLYPQLGVAWNFAEQWHLDVLLPNHVEVTYNPQAELLLNVGVSLEGDEYHVRGPSAIGKPQFDWQTQEMRLYAGATWRFDDQVSVFGRIGSIVGGDEEFNGTVRQMNGTPGASLFLEFGTGFDW